MDKGEEKRSRKDKLMGKLVEIESIGGIIRKCCIAVMDIVGKYIACLFGEHRSRK